MPGPNLTPTGTSPVIFHAPDSPVPASGRTAEVAKPDHIANTPGPTPETGLPTLPLHEAEDPNFLRSPRGELASSHVRPFLTPQESARLAQTSHALHLEITGEPEFRLEQRYLQLRRAYVEDRQRLSKAQFNGKDVASMLTLSRFSGNNLAQRRCHKDVNAFLSLRTVYIAQCMAIAAERQVHHPLPNYALLQKIDRLLANWNNVTAEDLLAFEEELLAVVDNTAEYCNAAYSLDRHFWILKEPWVLNPFFRLADVREDVRGEIDRARERLLELIFADWHPANDPVETSLPPENRVHFFHHPPATDWTADKVLEQPANVDPVTGAIQTDEHGQPWIQQVAWPNPADGEVRHNFHFYSPMSRMLAYSCVHVFNSTSATIMEDPD